MSDETKCGICGEGVPSLLDLSKHECKISLKEAYDRAWAGVPKAPLTATARADQFGACVFFNRGGSDFRSAMPDKETALLVAAAPELLEALKAAREFIAVGGSPTSSIDAVIAKAEGRS